MFFFLEKCLETISICKFSLSFSEWIKKYRSKIEHKSPYSIKARCEKVCWTSIITGVRSVRFPERLESDVFLQVNWENKTFIIIIVLKMVSNPWSFNMIVVIKNLDWRRIDNVKLFKTYILDELSFSFWK